jgi:hypothetical protein
MGLVALIVSVQEYHVRQCADPSRVCVYGTDSVVVGIFDMHFSHESVGGGVACALKPDTIRTDLVWARHSVGTTFCHIAQLGIPLTASLCMVFLSITTLDPPRHPAETVEYVGMDFDVGGDRGLCFLCWGNTVVLLPHNACWDEFAGQCCSGRSTYRRIFANIVRCGGGDRDAAGVLGTGHEYASHDEHARPETLDPNACVDFELNSNFCCVAVYHAI